MGLRVQKNLILHNILENFYLLFYDQSTYNNFLNLSFHLMEYLKAMSDR